MTTPFARGMTRATELTQAGKLEEATTLIQSLIRNRDGAEDAPVAGGMPMDRDVIDGAFTRIDAGEAGPDAAAPSAAGVHAGVGPP